ncbi:GNAT family N-acetyltransferase [Streptomyces sioyaensis]|uniref:GNAT family N-acetyltransferase n=1 Tax=Streptomyces sioyaensis TaxID=67364 RepID=UPI0037944EDB
MAIDQQPPTEGGQPGITVRYEYLRAVTNYGRYVPISGAGSKLSYSLLRISLLQAHCATWQHRHSETRATGSFARLREWESAVLMDISIGDLYAPDVVELLEGHVRELRGVTPPESVHALDLEGLRHPEVAFWSVRERGELLGCGAIQGLGRRHGEIKSMRTSAAAKRKGVATALLRHMISEATRRGFWRLSLETGTEEFFAPARTLYEKFGFHYCPPFGDYQEDPNSAFMTRLLVLSPNAPDDLGGRSAAGDRR